MLQRQMKKRLRVGRFLGIELFIHWSFWVLLFGFGGYSLLLGEGVQAAGVQVLQIVTLFTCVTLHEYGHAMMARAFGVRTLDITLLPIGGLARLERMPRIPWQELLVAVAGPAVNVVIAGLGLLILISGRQFGFFPSIQGENFDALLEATFRHPLGWLIVMNTALVLFNMIPAFPMDGGRVLRSLLAMFCDYRFATRTAARLGFVAAIGLGVLGFISSMPHVVLIALFIAYAGWAEARQVEMSEAIRGVRVAEGFVPNTPTVSATDSLQMLVEFFRRHTEPSVAVVGVNRMFLGILEIDRVAQAAAVGRWDMMASNLMETNVPTLRRDGLMENQVPGIDPGNWSLMPIVDGEGAFLGMLDARSLAARVQIARHGGQRTEIPGVTDGGVDGSSRREPYYPQGSVGNSQSPSQPNVDLPPPGMFTDRYA